MTGIAPLLLILVGGFVLPLAAEDEQEQKPILDGSFAEATLTIGERTITPVSVRSPWKFDRRVGDVRVTVDKDEVVATDVATGEGRWAAKADGGKHLRWLAADERTIYLSHQRADSELPPETEPTPTVLRLDVGTGEWLPPLVVPVDGKPEKGGIEMVLAVLPIGKRLIALTKTASESGFEFEDGSDGVRGMYRVTCFDRAGAKALWSNRYKSAGERASPAAFLLSNQRPDYASEDIQHLSALGKNVLICAGSVEDLIVLKPATGKRVWRLKRVWEFRRGFIGPSVWNHFIGRYGFDESDIKLLDNDPKEMDDAVYDEEYAQELRAEITSVKEKIEAESNAIIAGPVVVKFNDELYREPRRSIFVAVARSDDIQWPGYLSDCIVYELNAEGDVKALATLPRTINGWQGHVDDQGVVWRGPRNSWARLSATSGDSGGMLGSDDMLTHIPWYRELKADSPTTALPLPTAGDAVAFTDTHGFSVGAAGYILDAMDRSFHFPVTMIDLKSGDSTALRLDLPLGTKANEDSPAAWQINIGLTFVRVDGDALEIVVGMEDSAAGISFRLADLVPSKQ